MKWKTTNYFENVDISLLLPYPKGIGVSATIENMKLIDFIYHEVVSSGGDGDALWYSKFHNVIDILPLIKEYNDKLKFPWKVEFDGRTINWGDDQEWAMITNDEDLYKMVPSWSQITIRY